MALNIEPIRPKLGILMFQVVDSISHLNLEKVDTVTVEQAGHALEEIQALLANRCLVANTLVSDVAELARLLTATTSTTQCQAIADNILFALDAFNRYLYCCNSSRKCSPLALVSCINQLRTLTQNDLVNPYHFFYPSLAFSIVDSSVDQAEKKVNVAGAALQLHADFRGALLDWSSADQKKALMKLSKSTKALRKLTTNPLLQKLWWAAQGYVELLSHLGIGANDATTHYVLIQLDKVINEMHKQSEEVLPTDLVEESLRHVLFYFAKTKHDNALQLENDNIIQQLDEAVNGSYWFASDLGETPLFNWNEQWHGSVIADADNNNDSEAISANGDVVEASASSTIYKIGGQQPKRVAHEADSEFSNDAEPLVKTAIPFAKESLPDEQNNGEDVDFAIHDFWGMGESLESIHNNLSQWREEGEEAGNISILSSLQGNFIALKLHAEQIDNDAGVTIVELSGLSAKLLGSKIKSGDIAQNEAMLNLLNEVYDGLFEWSYDSSEKNTKHIKALREMVLLLIDEK